MTKLKNDRIDVITSVQRRRRCAAAEIPSGFNLFFCIAIPIIVEAIAFSYPQINCFIEIVRGRK
jgi:hypothetical protein